MNYPVALTLMGAIVVGSLTPTTARADQQTIKHLGQMAIYNVSIHYNALNIMAYDNYGDDFNREQALEALNSFDFDSAVAAMVDSLKSAAKTAKTERSVAQAARKAARDALVAQEASATQAAAKTAAAPAQAAPATQVAAAANASKATVNTAIAIEQAQVAQNLVAQAEISAQTLKNPASTPAQKEAAAVDVKEAYSKLNSAFSTSVKASAKARTLEAKAARQKAMEAKKAMQKLSGPAFAITNAIAEAKLSPLDRLTKTVKDKLRNAVERPNQEELQRAIRASYEAGKIIALGVRG